MLSHCIRFQFSLDHRKDRKQYNSLIRIFVFFELDQHNEFAVLKLNDGNYYLTMELRRYCVIRFHCTKSVGTAIPVGRVDFRVAPNIVGPQVSSSVVEHFQFFKLFFTDEIVDEIVDKFEFENNNQKLYVANVEFWAFIAVVKNMGTMPISNMQEYWPTNENSRIPFFPAIFTRSRFNQIFWMLQTLQNT
uniref:PiggyBac transposable element-derived protein domain-containing protein n=1 Tax=Glossina palpalis gambiensis TaxID=67801 RepID=A0A1B0AQP1_9MUSC